MTLLAIILGLSIEKLMPTLLQYRRFDWLFSYQQWMKEKFSQLSSWDDTFSLLSIILLPIIAVAFIHYKLYESASLLGFSFSVLVLAYSLGPRDIYGLTQQLLDLPAQDCTTELRTIAGQLLTGPLPEDQDSLFTMVKNKLLISINTNLLAVLFWFAVLGPMGAILYRLTLIIHESQDKESSDSDDYASTAAMFFAILNWIPAHLAALSFAATGSFVDALHNWKDNIVKSPLSNEECDSMLTSVGLGAMRLETNNDICDAKPVVNGIIAMAKRSIILWLTALALLTMSGWAG
jgi:AmpE protein